MNSIKYGIGKHQYKHVKGITITGVEFLDDLINVSFKSDNNPTMGVFINTPGAYVIYKNVKYDNEKAYYKLHTLLEQEKVKKALEKLPL